VRPAGTEARWLRAVTDDVGGIILAWQDRSHEDSLGVFAQHLDGSGTRLWDDNGLRISNYPGDPEMTADGDGGAYIVWTDARPGIYMQRVAGDGSLRFPVDGLQLPGSSGAFPEIVSDGAGGVIVAWLNAFIGEWDISARRFAPDGSPLWPNRLVVDNDGWYDFDLRADGAGGMILAWPSGDPNQMLRAQRLGPAGQVMWPSQGVVVANLPRILSLPDMIATGDGGAILAWQDLRTGCQGIYAQRLAPNGTTEWQENGVVVTERDLHQYQPRVIPGGPYDALVMWRDPDGAGDILYLTYLAAWTNGLVEECSLPPPTDVPEVSAASLQLASQPNPFNPRTQIIFALPRPAHAQLTVFDTLGRKVATLVDSHLPAGEHRVTWDGRHTDGAAMPSGIYLVRLQQGAEVEVRKTTLIR
jgi:hypothetical protein